MSIISLDIPQRILKELEERAHEEDKPLDEVVLEALLAQTNLKDPEARSEIHLKLCEKFIREAEEFLKAGDYIQASEKAWGGAAQSLKALAARRGEELHSHSELHKYIGRLRKETGDAELILLWFSATSLHQNFYEAWLPPEAVSDGIENVKKFIEKLKGYK
jgi:uncharacterized protein (UPF0332 family)